MKMNVSLLETTYFCYFLKTRENSNYVNYLENNIFNESSRVAVYIQISTNCFYEVFWHQNQTPWTWLFKRKILKLICFDSVPHHPLYCVHSPLGVFLSTSKNTIASELYVFISLNFLLDKWHIVPGKWSWKVWSAGFESARCIFFFFGF